MSAAPTATPAEIKDRIEAGIPGAVASVIERAARSISENTKPQ